MMAEAKEGASEGAVRAKLDISIDLWYRLIKEEPEFSEAVRKAKEACETWWIEKGRAGLHDKTFQYVLWYMNMKNRFGWADKQEIKQTNLNTEVTPASKELEELVKLVEAEMRKRKVINVA